LKNDKDTKSLYITFALKTGRLGERSRARAGQNAWKMAVLIVLIPPTKGNPVRFRIPDNMSWSRFEEGVRSRLKVFSDDYDGKCDFFVDGGRVQILNTDDFCDGKSVKSSRLIIYQLLIILI
jgi:hypothetical protein